MAKNPPNPGQQPPRFPHQGGQNPPHKGNPSQAGGSRSTPPSAVTNVQQQLQQLQNQQNQIQRQQQNMQKEIEELKRQNPGASYPRFPRERDRD